MTKLTLFLMLILVISALGVVTAQHEARKLSISLEKERIIARQLKVEWGQLQLEQSTLGRHARIENIASEQLNMNLPTTSDIQIITTGNFHSEGVLEQ